MRRMLDVDIPGRKKKRVAKPKMERRVQERHDRGGVERGQRNKQGRMEEEAVPATPDDGTRQRL